MKAMSPSTVAQSMKFLGSAASFVVVSLLVLVFMPRAGLLGPMTVLAACFVQLTCGTSLYDYFGIRRVNNFVEATHLDDNQRICIRVSDWAWHWFLKSMLLSILCAALGLAYLYAIIAR